MKSEGPEKPLKKREREKEFGDAVLQAQAVTESLRRELLAFNSVCKKNEGINPKVVDYTEDIATRAHDTLEKLEALLGNPATSNALRADYRKNKLGISSWSETSKRIHKLWDESVGIMQEMRWQTSNLDKLAKANDVRTGNAEPASS